MAPKGTVAIEEAVLDPAGIARNAKDAVLYAPGADMTTHPLTKALLDIHSERLAHMDAEGVEYMVLSLTSPGPQGSGNRATAQQIATSSNDWIAGEVARNPARFGAFASVSMHDADEAAAELRRAVKELGLLGAIINDYQTVDVDGKETKRYYDTKEYHPFWKAVEELDVPVYLHPRYRSAAELDGDACEYSERKHLLGASMQFHLDLSFHIYALCSSGLFDLFPKVQVIAGHLGENIPLNLWRADHWYNKPMKKAKRPSKEDYMYYFKHNIHITTSGNFSTQGLKFCINELGVDRCMFSIDYPYDTVKEAQDWWKGIDLPDDQKEAVGRANAIRLLKLPLEL